MPATKYSESFEAFWKAYPRKTAKTAAFKAWVKIGVDGDAFMPKQALQDVEKRTRLGWWPKDTSKIPHGATWINQMRWEDEGWEDEIKTREEGPNKATTFIPPPPRHDDAPEMSGWEMMCNRVMRSYLMAAGGFTDERLAIFVRTKRKVLAQITPVIDEELDGTTGNERKEKRTEMAYVLASTLLRHLDDALGLTLADRILRMKRA